MTYSSSLFEVTSIGPVITGLGGPPTVTFRIRDVLVPQETRLDTVITYPPGSAKPTTAVLPSAANDAPGTLPRYSRSPASAISNVTLSPMQTSSGPEIYPGCTGPGRSSIFPRLP